MTATSTREPFGARLAKAMDERGPLCVGIDPHPALLASWGLPDDVEGLRSFSLAVIREVGSVAAAVKPQSALFERHGSRGVAVLEEVVAASAEAGVLCIVDAKRGDIGSTMAGYADAYLRDGSPLAGDAVTLSPYLGFGSLDPALEVAGEFGRGTFVLALTSNPEGAEVQHARGTCGGESEGEAVAAAIARQAGALNAAELARTGGTLGSVGLVVGATIGGAAAELGIDLASVRGPLLAPGIGAQGAGAAELEQVFGDARRAVLASSSREVLGAGPGAGAVRAAAERTIAMVAAALGR